MKYRVNINELPVTVRNNRSFRAVNFLTPQRTALHLGIKYTVEVSKGKGMTGDDVWGVTAYDNKHGVNLARFSGLFHSLPEVTEQILTIEKYDNV
jgi:hypothetical protein